MALLDSLVGPTTITAAYSLGRLLRGAYGGYAFTVRRSSDGATQSIGFTVTGAVNVAALLAFCAGTNGYVTTIFEQSGSGAGNLTQATASLQPQIVSGGALLDPINGLPSCGGGYMSASVSYPNSTTSTTTVVAAAVNTNATSGNGLRLCSYIASGQSYDSNNTPSWLCASSVPGYSGPTLAAYRNGTSSDATGPSSTPLVFTGQWTGSQVLASAVSLSSGSSSYTTVSGSAASSTGNFGSSGTLNFLWQGSQQGGGPNQWSGYASELVVAAVMAPADLSAVQASLEVQYLGVVASPELTGEGLSPPFRPGMAMRRLTPPFSAEAPLSFTYAQAGGIARESLYAPSPQLQVGALAAEALYSIAPPPLQTSSLVVEVLIQPPANLQAWPKPMGPIFRPGMSVRAAPWPFGVQAPSGSSNTLQHFVVM